MEFYSATKMNEILSPVGKWVELEIIVLREINLTHNIKNSIFSHLSIWGLEGDVSKQGTIMDVDGRKKG